jgi:GntR family transcriptional regulator/MocR family aminotransferase
MPPGGRQRAIYEALRDAVLDRRLPAGTRVASSRDLAAEYGVARGTVVAVLEQLVAEGYFVARIGSGTFVRDSLPDDLLRRSARLSRRARPGGRAPGIASRAEHFRRAPFPSSSPGLVGRSFVAHQPALDLFPIDLWSRLVARASRRMSRSMLVDGDPRGWAPLRRALASYLRVARGVRCEAEQIVVVSGVQQGLDLVGRVVLDPGDITWCEDPGYIGARSVLEIAGVRVEPVRVDNEGLDVAAGERSAPGARLAYVTPARQSPLGIAMSLGRRMALLDWARRSRAWVFEDDYDSEYRYEGRPLPALHALDEGGCVIVGGSFSKTLLPALRLGYVVLPERIADLVTNARALVDRYPAFLGQAVLCEFLSDGHYARHLRRMREAYAERRHALVHALERRIGETLRPSGDAAGLDLVAWLPRSASERDVVRAAAARDLVIEGVGRYRFRHDGPPGLLLGFAACTPRAIAEGVDKLALALRDAGLRTSALPGAALGAIGSK